MKHCNSKASQMQNLKKSLSSPSNRNPFSHRHPPPFRRISAHAYSRWRCIIISIIKARIFNHLSMHALIRCHLMYCVFCLSLTAYAFLPTDMHYFTQLPETMDFVDKLQLALDNISTRFFIPPRCLKLKAFLIKSPFLGCILFAFCRKRFKIA